MNTSCQKSFFSCNWRFFTLRWYARCCSDTEGVVCQLDNFRLLLDSLAACHALQTRHRMAYHIVKNTNTRMRAIVCGVGFSWKYCHSLNFTFQILCVCVCVQVCVSMCVFHWLRTIVNRYQFAWFSSLSRTSIFCLVRRHDLCFKFAHYIICVHIGCFLHVCARYARKSTIRGDKSVALHGNPALTYNLYYRPSLI